MYFWSHRNGRIGAALLALCVGSTIGPAAAVAAPPAVDAAIAPYQSRSGVSGNLDSIGSDTLNNLMTLWAESFRKLYPSVRIQVEGKGSSTAPPALIAGSAQLGPMSREMKPTEIDEFEKAFGYPPTRIRVGVDALAVYVNKDNPLERLTLPQLDAIFSKTRTCGTRQAIDTWGDAGLAESTWASRPISLYGRNSASGTYGFFKEVALCGGDFRDTVKEQPGSASVVQGVAEELAGVGYSGIGYRTSGVKTLEIARKEGDPFVSVEPANVLAGRYPLARFLYIYLNRAPGRPLSPTVEQFLRFVLSRQGQEAVVKDGYLPLPARIVGQELEQLD